MTAEKSGLFFIALVPPQEIQAQVETVRDLFVERYGSAHAKKSPPHITLKAPFHWPKDLPEPRPEAELHQFLRQFSQDQAPFAVALDGFSSFPPRVIYLRVENSTALNQIQKTVVQGLKSSFGLAAGGHENRFVPHMTVAFKDLTPRNYHLAWAEFASQPLRLDFMATDLVLLAHNGQRWQVEERYPFLQTTSRH
ncbi:2'-5' RNA ligase family protein [Leptolyngbya sp. FACHB-261]|uniref:2'-5' RNA ligase family protein n=1 Tax=Leptolyngbya sp. FACHB-261 TaxID=2692806 RepID=UPI001682D56E|nr:2'-5' RNA ligase family protein [Leptolyngbya sp. FACHB-261]MBD2105060.1 2'-5' RNA ligase family protein [Leptolyngbya sp. FACHB-261]